MPKSTGRCRSYSVPKLLVPNITPITSSRTYTMAAHINVKSSKETEINARIVRYTKNHKISNLKMLKSTYSNIWTYLWIVRWCCCGMRKKIFLRKMIIKRIHIFNSYEKNYLYEKFTGTKKFWYEKLLVLERICQWVLFHLEVFTNL